MNKTTGILRKTNYQQNVEPHPELLVFAYSAKIIRDDKKALEFDRHSHLIPAPFEPDNLISRYDVRATLDSVPTETHDSYMNRMDFLSPAEQQAEAMAEKERYYSLYTNEVEEEMYKEELMKREQTEMYSQVAFSYDAIGPQESSAVSAEVQEPDESEPFTPSVRLDLPVDMEFPASVKLNQIIEKTAKFISSQGPQMEILLKTKQASNPQFNFLNHDGQYNAYYKHIMSMMKAGTYPWEDTARDKTDENSQDSEDLSVSGTSSPAPVTSIIIPKMSFKPSADCAYTQLISKITKAPISEIERQQENQNNGASIVEVVKKPNGLTGLVHYSSDSESEEEEETPLQVNVIYSGIIPPSELQLVIDKTAAYVAKNGTDFEATLRKKNDTRFQFLETTHEFHQYYLFKVNESRGGAPPAPTIGSLVQPKVEVKLPKPPPAPVCFSIKSKEEKAQLKPTILQASSDDEGKPLTIPDPPRITTVEEELELQVDVMNAEREEKLAKERLSDKLFFAAKEKLGKRKDKMLQIERKKKALMFINQIKDSNGNGNPTNGGEKEDEIINLTHYGEDSDESVKSIPMSPIPSASRETRSRKRSSSHHRRHSRSSSSSSSRSPERRRSKKSKSKKSKKKYRKRDRRSSSRSRSRSRSRDRKRDRRDRRY